MLKEVLIAVAVMLMGAILLISNAYKNHVSSTPPTTYAYCYVKIGDTHMPAWEGLARDVQITEEGVSFIRADTGHLLSYPHHQGGCILMSNPQDHQED